MIQKLLEKGEGCYYLTVGKESFYFCAVDKRSKSQDMLEITIRDVVKKIDEIIEQLNKQ